MFKVSAVLASLVLLLSCVPVKKPDSYPEFQAQIRWTSYGIPHVKAEDWTGLGYGFAYATATDGLCVIARDIMAVNGDLSRYLGADNGNLQSDVFHRGLLTKKRLNAFSAKQKPNEQDFARGYVAGYNRFLSDHVNTLPSSCAAKPWVRTINQDDLIRLTMGVGIRYGLGWFQKEIADAKPPTASPVATHQRPGTFVGKARGFATGIGSNAIALGADVTESGRGLLLGNPHYPWRGPSRFHMIHTTIPGELDVMGVSLMTTNRVAIGFNKDIAWSHTVSTALRFTLYKLQLNPENPLEYKYGGDYRPIVASNVDVQVLDENGDTSQRKQSIYLTHYGPVVMSKALPWSDKVAYAIRDVNVNNTRNTATYDALNAASSIDDVEAAISMQGVPWTNTIAADRNGTAFYADISVTPNVDAQLLERCRIKVAHLPVRIVVLDGSEPDCEWKTDERSAVPGALPAQEMPRIRRRDYVTNSNDSYWLSNPNEPLEGYSPIIGPERTVRTLRTRAGLNFVQQKLAEKEKLGPRDIQAIIYSQRNYAAEILLDDVLELCQDNTDPVVLDGHQVDISVACKVLAGWDRRQANESRGAQVWTEFWRSAQKIPGVYAIGFDPNDPVHTPSGIAIDDKTVAAAVRLALARAQTRLQDAGISMDARWGDIQYAERNGDKIAIPGGQGWAGMLGMIVADLHKNKGYTPIRHGNSYIQVISWDKEGRLEPWGMLTYSQSQEPGSDHYDDLTRLYSAGKWIRFPFSEAEIQADPELEVLKLLE